jgi:hypothetical protein
MLASWLPAGGALGPQSGRPPLAGGAALGAPVVRDRFGRTLAAAHGIEVVDWDGQVANPAKQLLMRPPANAVFRTHLQITIGR